MRTVVFDSPGLVQWPVCLQYLYILQRLLVSKHCLLPLLMVANEGADSLGNLIRPKIKKKKTNLGFQFPNPTLFLATKIANPNLFIEFCKEPGPE